MNAASDARNMLLPGLWGIFEGSSVSATIKIEDNGLLVFAEKEGRDPLAFAITEKQLEDGSYKASFAASAHELRRLMEEPKRDYYGPSLHEALSVNSGGAGKIKYRSYECQTCGAPIGLLGRGLQKLWGCAIVQSKECPHRENHRPRLWLFIIIYCLAMSAILLLLH